MIKQITNDKGSFLLFDTSPYKNNVKLIETINQDDKININYLPNFPKSLLTNHPLKKMIANTDYTVKVWNLNPNLWERYNFNTGETKPPLSSFYPKQGDTDWIYRIHVCEEPNIKVIDKDAFYDYFNSFNEPISEDDLMNLLKGFQGDQTDIDLTMKSLCYYDIRKFKSRIFIEYLNVRYKNNFSEENIYTKYIRDYINATTHNVQRTYYNLNGIYNIFDYVNETDIDYMQSHYIPLLTKEILSHRTFKEYIEPLQIKVIVSNKPIIDNNKRLKKFITNVNNEFYGLYNMYLKQSKLFISFVYDPI